MFFNTIPNCLLKQYPWHTEPNSRLVVKDGVLGVVGDVLRHEALHGGYHGHVVVGVGQGDQGVYLAAQSDQSYSRTQAMRIFSWNDGFVASDSLRTSS